MDAEGGSGRTAPCTRGWAGLRPARVVVPAAGRQQQQQQQQQKQKLVSCGRACWVRWQGTP
ncbi:hypothetical protein D7Y50_12010 [Stenotrophomonas maltophilia]|nr:hypothetical protein [Stenotrophomonas maltophilia]MBA0268891.1 hypothetical protein [Stenotrophomonas maltophilia]MBA0332702.1 hypothetical protein [Stenotrophomonas maltophilia]